MKCRKAHNHTFGKITTGLAVLALGYFFVSNIKDILRYIRISSM
jgi:hypothetical protein